jgi:hypothetical protein
MLSLPEAKEASVQPVNDMSSFKELWVEKYRPTTLAGLLLEDNVRVKILNYKDEIPNLLFCSPPGQGKTSLAKIIVNDILQCQYLYLNASDENGIDVIRSKVSSFAQTKSIDGKIKVVILDEADYITSQGQAALRNTMETYSDTCRFILTANLKHKIVPAIQSRCTSFDIVPPLRDAVYHCFNILKLEDIEYEENDKRLIAQLVKNAYPDLRTAINNLQKSVIDGKLNIREKGIDGGFCNNILQMIDGGNPLKIREYIITNETEFNGDYPQLLRTLLEAVYNSWHKDEIKQQWCIIIAEHLYRAVFVVDQEINCFACILQMCSV